jgi:hypothetical protein
LFALTKALKASKICVFVFQDKNYVLVKTSPPIDKSLLNNINRIIPGQQRCNDAMRAKMDSWSEFASWNHLVNDTPYW